MSDFMEVNSVSSNSTDDYDNNHSNYNPYGFRMIWDMDLDQVAVVRDFTSPPVTPNNVLDVMVGSPVAVPSTSETSVVVSYQVSENQLDATTYFIKDGNDLEFKNQENSGATSKAKDQCPSSVWGKPHSSVSSRSKTSVSSRGRTEIHILPLGKGLAKFQGLVTIIRAPGIKNKPLSQLEASEEFCRFENWDMLENCFQHCGNALQESHLQIQEFGGSLGEIFFPEALPILRKLHITFPKRNPIPPGLQYIRLPETITDLELNCTMNSDDLSILAKNKLPNLTNLDLLIPPEPLRDGLLTTILENVSSTLKRLYIVGVKLRELPRRASLVRFPTMRKLQDLKIASINVELENESVFLEEFVSLRKFKLYYQTPTMLHKWARTGCPQNLVLELEFLLVDANLTSKEENTLPMTLEDMRCIHLTFPNVNSLALVLSSGDVGGLRYVLKELPQLTYLNINIHQREDITTTDVWDGILIGASPELIAKIREDTGLWRNIELKNELPSIRNLKNLDTLCLCTNYWSTQNGSPVPIISDLVFHFGFLQMDALAFLNFEGGFKPSHKMARQWINQDPLRVLTYDYLKFKCQ